MTLLVLDTTVLMDAMKDDDAKDAPPEEVKAARELLARILEGSATRLAFSNGMLAEWSQKRLTENDAIIRTLMDNGKLKHLTPVRLSGGQRSALGQHVDYDDQVFVLTAAAIPKQRARPCVTRDPKTTRAAARKYVKAQFEVTILLASEHVGAG